MVFLESERKREGGRRGERRRKKERNQGYLSEERPCTFRAVAIMYVCMTLYVHKYVCMYARARLCVATLREKSVSRRRAF